MTRQFRVFPSIGWPANGILLSLGAHAALAGAALYISAPSPLEVREEQSIAVEIILEDVNIAAVESPEDNTDTPAEKKSETGLPPLPAVRDRPEPRPDPVIVRHETPLPELPEPAVPPDETAILSAIRADEKMEVSPPKRETPETAERKPVEKRKKQAASAVPKVKNSKIAASTAKSKGLAVSEPSRASRQTGKSGQGRVETASENRALSSYRAMLNARIRSSQRSLRADGRGKVIVSFTLNRTGRIVSTRLRRSSGIGALDAAVMAMIGRIGSFPPFPPEIRANSLPVSIPVVFE